MLAGHLRHGGLAGRGTAVAVDAAGQGTVTVPAMAAVGIDVAAPTPS
jgi:hypothetical protein